MQQGGGFLLLGCMVTALTYAISAETGGFFIVAWGAVVFGGLRFLLGLAQFFAG